MATGVGKPLQRAERDYGLSSNSGTVKTEDREISAAGPMPSRPVLFASLVRDRLGQRPLLARFGRCRFVPFQLSKLRLSELLMLGTFLTLFAMMLWVKVLSRLTVAGCLAYKNKADCYEWKYRVKKAGKGLGGPGYTLTAMLLLPMTRGSIVSWATGLSYEKLVKWHRWLARLLVIVGILHGLSFFISWIPSGSLYSKSIKSENLAGIIATAISVLIFATSLEWVRRRHYNFFWGMHVLLGPALLISLWFHHDPFKLLFQITIPILLLVADKVFRSVKALHPTRSFEVHSIRSVGRDVVRVELSGPSSLFEKPHPFAWVSILIPAVSRKEIHPFSLCNLGDRDRSLVFYVKVGGTWTRALLDRRRELGSVSALVDGPYGGLELPHPIEAYDSLLFVAGGIGITPILPVVARLACSSSFESPLTLVWSVRDTALVKEFSSILMSCAQNISVFIYFTGLNADPLPHLGPDISVEDSGTRPFLTHYAHSLITDVPSTITRRPRVAVLACGPESMVVSAFLAAAHEEAEAGNVIAHLHEETFEM